MPLYDYDCAACGRRFEVIHGVHADPPGACPLCGKGPVKKAITAASVHYKGSGWAKKERRAAIKTNAASRADDEGPSDAGASGSDGGPSPSEPGSSPPTPAAAASGEASTGTPKHSKPSKAEAPSKTPAGTPD